MGKWVLALEQVAQADVELVGNKAAVLGELSQAGFPVPPGLCVTTAVFHHAFAPYQAEIGRLLQQVEPDEPETAVHATEAILNQLEPLQLPAIAISELQNLLATPNFQQQPLAVRSSATAEDRDDASFAGQYATLIGVENDLDTVLDAIRSCWLSFFMPNALFERAQHGATSLAEGMAVLIQPVIAADCAGVCFTVDPIRERSNIIVVNAAWGLGEGVVDGSMPTDSYWLQRQDISLEYQHIVEKGEMMGLDGALPVPKEQQRSACLPATWAQRVAQFGLMIERHYGVPQDVEWAIVDGRFWLLQSRPLTALPPELATVPSFPVAWPDEEAAQSAWQLMNYSRGAEPPPPLAHDYMAVRESIVEETCLQMGVERNEEIRIWNGRAYARRIPLPLTAADVHIRQQARKDLEARQQALGITSWDYWGGEVEQMVARLRQFDTEKADGTALATFLAEAQAVLRYGAAIHPRAWFKPRSSYFEAFSAVSGLKDAAAETAAYQLLDGEESKFTQLIDQLYELAQVAKRETAVFNLLTALPADAMAQLNSLPAAAPFLAALDDLLAEYGDRVGDGYGSETTILTPTWREEPELSLRLVQGYLQIAEAPAAVRRRLRKRRDEQVCSLLASCADETAVANFQQQLTYARRCMSVLEDHNHAIEQGCGGQLRRATMAAAKRLVAKQMLASKDDIFWLTFLEIEAALRDEQTENLAELVAIRQAEWGRFAELAPPPVLGIPEAELPARPPFQDEVTVGEGVDEENGRLTGLGASPGEAFGQACVVAKGEPLPPLKAGTILVAQNAGPLWTPYFPQLGGLVLEEGSLGQHAAATAREYGIPAVINCRQATAHIVNGDWLKINGATGLVIVDEAE